MTYGIKKKCPKYYGRYWRYTKSKVQCSRSQGICFRKPLPADEITAKSRCFFQKLQQRCSVLSDEIIPAASCSVTPHRGRVAGSNRMWQTTFSKNIHLFDSDPCHQLESGSVVPNEADRWMWIHIQEQHPVGNLKVSCSVPGPANVSAVPSSSSSAFSGTACLSFVLTQLVTSTWGINHILGAEVLATDSWWNCCKQFWYEQNYELHEKVFGVCVYV